MSVFNPIGEAFDPVTGEVDAFIPSPGMPKAIAQAIVVVCKQVKQLGVDDKNDHGGYKFVSVDKFYERIGKMMGDAGLAVLVDEVSSEVREGAKGNPWLFMRYELRFMHDLGEVSPPMRRSCALPISGPQAFGAAQSYIEKQFLRQVFKVPTGERDADETAQDGEAPTRASAPPQTQQRAPRPPAATAAPSDAAKQEARKRFQMMRDEIGASPSAADIDALLVSPAWDAMVEHVKGADPEKADAVIAQLTERAHVRQEQLGQGGPNAGEYA